MSRLRIYLGGPIGGLSFKCASRWRNEARDLLAPMDAISPLRNFEGVSQDWDETGECPIPHATRFFRDYDDVNYETDAALFNFVGATRKSIGSAMEIAWSFRRTGGVANYPFIIAMEPGNINEDLFLNFFAPWRVPTLICAINGLRKRFGYPQHIIDPAMPA